MLTNWTSIARKDVGANICSSDEIVAMPQSAMRVVRVCMTKNCVQCTLDTEIYTEPYNMRLVAWNPIAELCPNILYSMYGNGNGNGMEAKSLTHFRGLLYVFSFLKCQYIDKFPLSASLVKWTYFAIYIYQYIGLLKSHLFVVDNIKIRYTTLARIHYLYSICCMAYIQVSSPIENERINHSHSIHWTEEMLLMWMSDEMNYKIPSKILLKAFTSPISLSLSRPVSFVVHQDALYFEN